MCRCTPEIRTPWCGKAGCEMPNQDSPLPALTAADYGRVMLLLAMLRSGAEFKMKSEWVESLEALLDFVAAPGSDPANPKYPNGMPPQ